MKNKFEKMIEMKLDYILVPLGFLVLGIYHVWLLLTIHRNPAKTVIGFNTLSRHRWTYHIMRDQQKNGIVAVQTLRNNLTASTVLASISITLSSLISAVVSDSTKPGSIVKYTLLNVKYFSLLLCFLLAFFCNVQCVRYYSHASFLLSVPSPDGRDEFIEYVADILNQGGRFWSLGVRAFYLSFPLLLWIFGPIPMFASSCLMSLLLYFLDTTWSMSKYLPNSYMGDSGSRNHDYETMVDVIETTRDDNLYPPFLGSIRPGSSTDAVI